MPSIRAARLGFCTLLTALVSQLPLGAQQAERARPVLSPEVHADRRVTFRLQAPQAEAVSVIGEFMDGPQAMTKGADGVWSVTVGPVAPEVYEYDFTIDGMMFLDPRNPAVKTNQGPSAVSSLVTVKGEEPFFFDVRPVPTAPCRSAPTTRASPAEAGRSTSTRPRDTRTTRSRSRSCTSCTARMAKTGAGRCSGAHTRFSTTYTPADGSPRWWW